MSGNDPANIGDVLFVIVFLFAILIVAGLMGLAIGLWIAYGQEIESYEDCIKQNISEVICNALYPPITLQNVNWTIGVLPFP